MEDFYKCVKEQIRKDSKIIYKFDKSVAESISNSGADLIRDLFYNYKVSNDNT
jgi:hypothetical protein